MKKKLSLLIVIGLIVLGGCGMNNEEENVSPSEMNAEDLPDVPAFQDDFTKEFLQSTEPVREGFYPFLSKSESFTMDFSGDMVVSSKSYNIGPDNRSEYIVISDTNKDNDILIEHQLHYYNSMSSKENSKKQLIERMGVNLDFQEIGINTENQFLESAKSQYNENNYTIASLLWNDNNQQIQIITSILCNKDMDEDKCKALQKDKISEVNEWLKSIQLVQDEGE